MRQRLIKAIYCIALSVSVFFCTYSISLAAEQEEETEVSDSEVIGQVELIGDIATFSTGDDGMENVYQGAVTMQVYNAVGVVNFTNMTGSELTLKTGFSSFDMVIPVVFRMEVERGHTYSGQISFPVTLDIHATDGTTGHSERWARFGIFDVDLVSEYENVALSYYDYQPIYTTFENGSTGVWVNFVMNNFQSSFDGTLTLNAHLYFKASTQTLETTQVKMAYVPLFTLTASIPTDYAGDLYDYPTAVITDSTGSLISNQTQQQQQIADQQAQQSAQQHEDLKNGFQDDTYNSNVSNAGSSIDNYVNLESDLMNDKNQQVVNYADQAFKLDSVQPYANAILACSTFYTAIWNSFGEFNIVFVVILALGVAGLVLGLTRRK